MRSLMMAAMAAFVLGSASPALAQIVDDPTGKAMQHTQKPAGNPAAKSDDTSAGKAGAADQLGQISLFDKGGKNVGTIERSVTQPDGSSQLVASVGGFLGIGEHKVLLNADQVAPMEGGEGYRTELTEEQISNLPEFKEDGTTESPATNQ